MTLITTVSHFEMLLKQCNVSCAAQTSKTIALIQFFFQLGRIINTLYTKQVKVICK